MKLYELAEQYRIALDAIEEAEEITPEQLAILEAVEDDFNHKVESVAKYIRNIEAEETALLSEIKRLAARTKTTTNKKESLKRYLQNMLEATGKQNVDGELLKVSLRKSPVSCEITDEAIVPEQFKETVTEVKIRKKELIDHFKASGEVIDGVVFHTNNKTVTIK